MKFIDELSAERDRKICRICGEPGTPGDHGGNCQEKDQTLRDFEQERA